jgi:hypothetical protein
LELYVYSEKFDEDCARYRREFYLKDDDDDECNESDDSDRADGGRLSDKHPDSPYDVSELEAYLYYLGIRDRTLWSQVDLPDVQGCLQVALGRTSASCHAASASLRAPQTWQRQSVGYDSF